MSQSVSVVNLIKAGGKRWSNREQVPLTVESGSTLGLALPLSVIVLPALCSPSVFPCNLSVFSPLSLLATTARLLHLFLFVL